MDRSVDRVAFRHVLRAAVSAGLPG